ncbi:MAG: sialate O-acetylesterase [Pirellulaceae bacterium]
MTQQRPLRSFLPLLVVVLAMHPFTTAAQPKKLRVFILAGQSNMEGHAKVETFDYIGDDPATAPLLKQMRGADGKPAVCDNVWISYFTGSGTNNAEGFGKLTAGYGSRSNHVKDGGKIGPEFTFGLTVDAALHEPVLIIKTAWGGKSLHTDFRPPSAGPYQLNDYQKKLYYGPPGHGVPEDMDQWLADKERETGHYYRLMVEHVKMVLADPRRVVPGYAPAQGYELAGFVWLQGWNDMVDGHTYPAHGKPGRFDLYSEWLSHFIRDVRRDLNAPKLPFVIGVMGVGGAQPGADIVEFRKAMAAPASLPEFKGNVVAVETAPFWSEELGAIDNKRGKVSQMRYFLDSQHKDYANADGKMTEEQKREFVETFEADLITPAEDALWKRGASNAGYHYLGCAKTLALMGRAFAEAALGDVLLGAGGKPFPRDPRTEMGRAITAAEREAGGGRLALTRWRAGKAEEVTLKLPVLGPNDQEKARQ